MTKAEHERLAERTRDLKLRVIMGIGCEGNGNAALEAVPVWAFTDGKCPLPTYWSLAESMGVNRSNLWICLTAYRGEERRDLRKLMEDFLELTRGGMWDVMSVVEDIATAGDDK